MKGVFPFFSPKRRLKLPYEAGHGEHTSKPNHSEGGRRIMVQDQPWQNHETLSEKQTEKTKRPGT
jgi:hypothetical protein